MLKRCAYYTALTFLCLFTTKLGYASETEKIFNIQISSSKANIALKKLAHQTQHSLLFQHAEIDTITTNAISGQYTLSQALKKLLDGTNLSGGVTDRGVITIVLLPQYKKNKSEITKMNIFNKKVLAGSIAAALSIPGSNVHAQDEKPVNAGQLEEIVVTAQFREQRLQDTPLAITAMNADMIRQRGDLALPDLASATPNVTFNSGTGQYAGAQLFIRGVGQTDPHPGLEPGVGIYIDDAYYGAVFGGDVDLLDLERVEILRGPQGTLAGANSIGGAVKLFSKKPIGDGSGYIEAGYGSNNSILARGAFDTTILPDELFLRVSAGTNSNDGYVDQVDFACANPSQAGTLPLQHLDSSSCVIGKAGGKDSTMARGALRWIPNDRLEVNFSIDATNQNKQPAAEVLSAINPAVSQNAFSNQQFGLYGVRYDDRFVIPEGKYITYSDYRGIRGISISPNAYSHNYGYTGTIDFMLSDEMSLKSISSYRNTSGYAPADLDASPLTASTNGRYLEQKQFTQELRLNGSSFNGLLDWTLGGFYYDARQHLGGTVMIGSSAIPFGGVFQQFDDDVESNKYAAFGTITGNITENFTLTAGLRYSHSNKAYKFHRTDPDPTGFIVHIAGAGLLDRSPDAITDHLDYRLAVQYNWTSNFMTYAQVATGFKDGGIHPFPVTINDVATFAEEEMTSYEAGIKSDLFNQHLRLNLAAFISKYSDLQLRGQVPSAGAPDVIVAVITNAGKVTMQGVEAEIEFAPTPEMLITASASYLDFSYDDLGISSTVSNGPCKTCRNIYTPEYKAYIAAQYEFDIDNFGFLIPRISADYQGSMFGDLANDPAMKIPSRWLINTRITWKSPDEKWETSLAVNNLLDEYYYTHSSQQYYGVGSVASNLGRPREMMVNVRYNF